MFGMLVPLLVGSAAALLLATAARRRLSRTPLARGRRIACLGDSFVDVQIAGVVDLPRWGTDCTCQSVSLMAGGSCANTARHLSGLGNSCSFSVSFFSALGDDEFGSFFLHHLSSEGLFNSLSETLLPLKDTPQSACVILSGQRDRAMISCYSSNAKLRTSSIASEMMARGPWSLLHLGGYFSCTGLHTAELLELCTRLRHNGTLLSLDLQYDASESWTGEDGHLFLMLPLLDIFLPSHIEAIGVANALSQSPGSAQARLLPPGGGISAVGDALDTLCAQYPELLVVIKCGEDGVKAGRGVTRFAHPAFLVDVVDPTGCGDAFDAGFLASMVASGAVRASLEPHVPTALRAGCAAGACCASMPGACAAPLRMEDLHHFQQRAC